MESSVLDVPPHVTNDRLIGHYPVRQVGPFLSAWLRDNEIGNSDALGGTVALMDICRHEIESVYLTGMQCFVSDECPDGITPNRPKNSTIPFNDFKFIKRFASENQDRVSVDPFMERMFATY